MTHSHPKDKTWHSFSWEDIDIFLNHGVQQLSGVDYRYRYTITRLPETKTEDTEMIQNLFGDEYEIRAQQKAFEAFSEGNDFNSDENKYDFIVKLFADKYNFKYKRMKNEL